MAQHLWTDGKFLFEYFLVFFFFVLGIHILPGQLPQKEVYKHINHSLDIVSPPLLYTKVSIDRSVSSSSSQIFVILVGNVATIKGVFLG